MTSTRGITGIAVAALLACPLAAAAEPFYIGGAGGLNLARDSDLESAAFNTEAEFDLGWLALGTFGYEYGHGLRTEIELGYRANDLDQVGGAGATGDATVWSGMVNVVYDFDVDWPVRPYVGAGLGAGRVKADGISPVSTTRIDDTDTAFAYQAMVGVEWAMTDRLHLNAGYRYFAVPDLEFRAASGANVDSEYSAHGVTLGLRFLLGPKPAKRPAAAVPAAAPMVAQPPPAPAPAPQVTPAPAPAAPRNYLVFFDHNSAQLTEAARAILRTAADNARAGRTSRITATGHADRSGGDAYNEQLSLRRADAVRAELVRLGIPANQIATAGRGERDPLVQTRDGVREPQNRRVEIVLQ
jgi:outer membrane protein OmpA-like peptidoglycan-associated protein